MKGILGLVVLQLFLQQSWAEHWCRWSSVQLHFHDITYLLTRRHDFNHFSQTHKEAPNPVPPIQGKRNLLSGFLRPREATETLSENPEFNVILGGAPSLPFYHPPFQPVVSGVRAAPSLRPAALGAILCSVSLLGLSLSESPSCIFIECLLSLL